MEFLSQGFSMRKASDKALSPSCRKVIINQLKKVPIGGEGSLLKVYEMDTVSHVCAGRYQEALVMGQKSIAAELNIFGVWSKS